MYDEEGDSYLDYVNTKAGLKCMYIMTDSSFFCMCIRIINIYKSVSYLQMYAYFIEAN